MSYLLFMDESGHDHRTMPYEVRGGVTLHASKLWPFVQAMSRLEYSSFGSYLREFRTELKGSKLLEKKRFKWAAQAPALSDEERRKHCRALLTKGLEHKTPTRVEFTAFGQASLEMATGMFELLHQHGAQVFAAAIPRSVSRPPTFEAKEFLRKDHVFLFERYFYFLEREQQHGLLIMDEVDKTDDRRFVRRLESYFQRTHEGRRRAAWIVPAPFFVSSDMAYPVQAADLAIYCINWGFRLRGRMDEPVRAEIASDFAPWLERMQFHGRRSRGDTEFETFGIVYVPDPYEPRSGVQ